MSTLSRAVPLLDGATPPIHLMAAPHNAESLSTLHCSLLSLGCIFGFASPQQNKSLTALRALKIAQRRLRPEVRTKLLGMSSARSDQSLEPEAWRFVFLDPGTSGNYRVVTVAAKASSEHPDTVEAFSAMKNETLAGNYPISQNKLALDSNDILSAAKNAAKLKGITAAEYRLTQQRSGQEPTWTVSFFAEGDTPVAKLQIGGKTGTVKILPKE